MSQLVVNERATWAHQPSRRTTAATATYRTCHGTWRWHPGWQHTPLVSARTGPCSHYRRSHTQAEIQRGRRRPDTASDTHRWRSARRSRRHTGPRTDTSYHGMGPSRLRGRCSNTCSVRIEAPQERPYASFPQYFVRVSLCNYRNTSSRLSGIVVSYPSSPLSDYIITFLRTLTGITELSPQKKENNTYHHIFTVLWNISLSLSENKF